jgi:phage shock protein PspC (stress-responsive transcriptional regulator)
MENNAVLRRILSKFCFFWLLLFGIALFLNVDVVLIRIIFLIALICGSAGFWIYLIILIAAPEARTAVEKCELRGIPATAENIKRFTRGF